MAGSLNSKMFARVLFQELGVSCLVWAELLKTGADHRSSNWACASDPLVTFRKLHPRNALRASILERAEACSSVTPAQNDNYARFCSRLSACSPRLRPACFFIYPPSASLCFGEVGVRRVHQSPRLAALPNVGTSVFGLLPVVQNWPGSGRPQR